jgi:CTP:phosphocholine cytidylyltransferase-like protein
MNEDIIYFILDTNSNAVKIGYSTLNNLKKRIIQLQIGSPNELKILGVIYGDRQTENQIHEHFSQYRIRGEWFAYNDEIIKYIDNSWNFDIIESLDKSSYKKLIIK